MERAIGQSVFEGRAARPAAEPAEAGFAALVERRSRFVFQVAYAVLRNAHDAEDAAQETFLKLYRGGGWRDMRDEAAFLARSAWRVAVDRLRARGVAGAEPDREMAAPDRSPEAAAVESDWNARVHRLIDALPEDLRQPLVLSAFEELDSPRIAAVLGIPEGTVRTRIARARSVLKQKLAYLKEARDGR
jgi:RNA polymerase sigma-70 factor (ECF subfamily)